MRVSGEVTLVSICPSDHVMVNGPLPVISRVKVVDDPEQIGFCVVAVSIAVGNVFTGTVIVLDMLEQPLESVTVAK